MKILVTGGAGFIGMHVAKKLIELGHSVVIIDNFNDYYDVKLKEDRIKLVSSAKVYRYDISDYEKIEEVFANEKFDKVCHLAAQAGVRYSLENPFVYIQSNDVGTLNLLECCRQYDVKDFVFASSSSVYGGNTKIPFSEDDSVDKPISLYAATKRSNELIAHVYHHLFGIRCTGLRFFTVYGEYGRPDMASWIFTENIIKGKPIKVFNYGKMKRDFTYISDVADGVVKALFTPFDYSIINLGNHKPVELLYFISLIEKELGKKAITEMLPMQAGDVPSTYADISKAKKLLKWEPSTSIEEGVKKFVKWFKEYKRIK
jgi:UDP-glucuronate 4-epimerase